MLAVVTFNFEIVIPVSVVPDNVAPPISIVALLIYKVLNLAVGLPRS